ncbi:hypothetical protein STSO111631_08395 [Stackebrandtia soli]
MSASVKTVIAASFFNAPAWNACLNDSTKVEPSTSATCASIRNAPTVRLRFFVACLICSHLARIWLTSGDVASDDTTGAAATGAADGTDRSGDAAGVDGAVGVGHPVSTGGAEAGGGAAGSAATGAAGAAVVDAGGVTGAATGGATAATGGATTAGAACPAHAPAARCSTCSRRCSRPAAEPSTAGRIALAHANSSNRRGAVVPRIADSASCVISAIRDRVAVPMRIAWPVMRSNCSEGTSMRPCPAASGTWLRTIRSRRRSNRSPAKRRGSCPAAITRSTHAIAAEPSIAASASHMSSRSPASVTPRSATVRSYVTPSGPAPAISWSRTDRVSRADPPPARMTSGYTSGSTVTPSDSHRRSQSPRIAAGGTRRNG